MAYDNYIGRFAPSPSGPLHLGSLTCALASYFDAKANNGLWLVRMEDIDPPREQLGADTHILHTLESHGLIPDAPVRYQSSRSSAYRKALETLNNAKLSYRCNCTRKRLATLAHTYDGHCIANPPPDTDTCAIRFHSKHYSNTIANKIEQPNRITFSDRVQGEVEEDFDQSGDFIIHRKDGFFAYQLAVSVDDSDQNVSHVVRGNDLLETTAKQICLIQALGGKAPEYAHIPVIVSSPGLKLSKQNRSPAVTNEHAQDNIKRACKALGLEGAPKNATIAELLDWGVNHWRIEKLAHQKEVMLASLV